MSMDLRWTVDRRRFAEARVVNACRDFMVDATGYVRQVADETVPIEEGTLGGSGGTDVTADGRTGSVYYDTPYAARQHEDLSFAHDGGRRAKWLERTLQEEADAVRELAADRLRDALR